MDPVPCTRVIIFSRLYGGCMVVLKTPSSLSTCTRCAWSSASTAAWSDGSGRSCTRHGHSLSFSLGFGFRGGFSPVHTTLVVVSGYFGMFQDVSESVNDHNYEGSRAIQPHRILVYMENHDRDRECHRIMAPRPRMEGPSSVSAPRPAPRPGPPARAPPR